MKEEGVVRSMPNGDRVLNVRGLAELLNCSPKTIYTRRATGVPLPKGFRSGRQTLWLESEVYEWMKQGGGSQRKSSRRRGPRTAESA